MIEKEGEWPVWLWEYLFSSYNIKKDDSERNRLFCSDVGLIHAAHIAACGSRGSGRGRNIGDQAFRRKKGCRYGSRVLQYGTGNLGRVDDTRFEHIPIFIVEGDLAVD